MASPATSTTTAIRENPSPFMTGLAKLLPLMLEGSMCFGARRRFTVGLRFVRTGRQSASLRGLGELMEEARKAEKGCRKTLYACRHNYQRARQTGKTEPMRSADRSAVQTIGAREDGERIARMRNRHCYGGADRRHLGHAGVRRRRRQAGQGKERKRRPDARHNGGSHWENRVKRQHGFDPRSFDSCDLYAPARIAAVTARTARAPGELMRLRSGHGLA